MLRSIVDLLEAKAIPGEDHEGTCFTIKALAENFVPASTGPTFHWNLEDGTKVSHLEETMVHQAHLILSNLCSFCVIDMRKTAWS